MSVTVQPIRPEERPRCQCCGKGLQPGNACRQSFGRLEGSNDPEASLAAFKTNRRVVRVRRNWHSHQARFDAPVIRSLSSIEVVFMPDRPSDWDAYDSLFCTLECARQFARAAHRAGYRMRTDQGSAP
jgi:hypothetical protein